MELLQNTVALFRKGQILFIIEKALKFLRIQRENRMLKEELNKKCAQS